MLRVRSLTSPTAGCASAAATIAGVSDVSLGQDAAASDEGESPLVEGVVRGIVVLPPAPLVHRGWVSLEYVAPYGSLMG